jgi:hypothetical protein
MPLTRLSCDVPRNISSASPPMGCRRRTLANTPPMTARHWERGRLCSLLLATTHATQSHRIYLRREETGLLRNSGRLGLPGCRLGRRAATCAQARPSSASVPRSHLSSRFSRCETCFAAIRPSMLITSLSSLSERMQVHFLVLSLLESRLISGRRQRQSRRIGNWIAPGELGV